MDVCLEQKLDFRKISFVHNALPDLSLEEVDTSLEIGSGKPILESPILVKAKSLGEAVRMSSSNKGVAFVAERNGSMGLYVDGNERGALPQGFGLEAAGDGIEAAKIIRAGGVPMIEEGQLADYRLYVQQLRIAMFLTDSKDINRLRKAPIYVTG